MSTATAADHAPFAYFDTGHPADILEGAAAVTRFLCDVSPHLAEGGGGGLTEKGAYGLLLILEGLEKTIEAAAAAL
ncbi:MAG: hypothetical protein ACD_75C00843G0001 [uncultured bacterium]|nr:MAG: hypothetical protein ACD_75C00843G0001 [uncultured bacterium]